MWQPKAVVDLAKDPFAWRIFGKIYYAWYLKIEDETAATFSPITHIACIALQGKQYMLVLAFETIGIWFRRFAPRHLFKKGIR